LFFDIGELENWIGGLADVFAQNGNLPGRRSTFIRLWRGKPAFRGKSSRIQANQAQSRLVQP